MQLNRFKKILLKEKTDILGFIENNADIDIDIEGDETDAIQAKILARSAAEILAKKQDKLSKINLAIKKIDAGSFGICEECGDDISEKRLMINPGFNLCISCSEHNEMIKKNNARRIY